MPLASLEELVLENNIVLIYGDRVSTLVREGNNKNVQEYILFLNIVHFI